MPRPETPIPADVQAITQSELGRIINEAFGASLRDDARIDEVFPRRLLEGNGESFENIAYPLRQSWQDTLAGFSKGERALTIMAVNQINYYRAITAGNGATRYEGLWSIIGSIETIAHLRGFSQEKLALVPGVGKKSAALLYAAVKKPE